MVVNTIGPLGVITSVFGLVAVIRQPKLLFVLVFPLAYFFYMTTMKVNFYRNFILIYPFIAILYGAALGVMYTTVKWLLIRLKLASCQDQRKLNILCLVLPLLFTGYLGRMATAEWNKAQLLANSRDSRSTLVEKINTLDRVSIVYIPKEIRMHEQDLRKLKYPHKIVSLEDLFGCGNIMDESVAIIPEQVESGGGPADEKLASSYAKAITAISVPDALLQAGAGVTRLSLFSVNPKLFVFDAARLTNCGSDQSSK